MDTLYNEDINYNIIKLLHNREQNLCTARTLQQHVHFTDNLIKRLSLEHELQGHTGCVNCIEWTVDGKYLASGSDDTNVILWDPFTHKKLKTINTPHIGNIFSVKFLGLNGTMVATGAGDCRVIVQDLNQDSSAIPLLDCSCHRGRVKRLATAPDQPLMFWSSSEDGIVLQYDMREPHHCVTNSTAFLDLAPSMELKCIAVNPTKPHYIAVGANDCYVRLYDRRSVKTKPYKFKSFEITDQTVDRNCAQYFTPGHLSNVGADQFRVAVTYVSFNSGGSELLANIGGDQIYLFEMDNPRSANELRIPHGADDLPTNHRIMVRPRPDSPPNNSERIAELDAALGLINNRNVPPPAHRKYNSRNYNILQEAIIGKRARKLIPVQEDHPKCASQQYIIKALGLLKRQWAGDIYSAAREYLFVIHVWPGLAEGFLGLIRCLVMLRWKSEASDWLHYFLRVHPGYMGHPTVEQLNVAIRSIQSEGTVDSAETESEASVREKCVDFASRYLGHCNTTTDIKEANFMGDNGRYVVAGSDDGIIFVWDRHTTEIVTALWGDVSIVNCVQPHPKACLIATSGIDPVVKLWTPFREDGTENVRQVKNLDTAVALNQRRMAMDPFETMLANMGYTHGLPTPGGSHSDMPTCRTS